MRITNRIVYVLIVLLIFCFLSWQDYDLLFQTKAATGIDGYYYVLQIDSLLERRGLYFPTSAPLVLYMLGGMAFIIGNQILAVKVGALLLHLLLCTGLGCFLYALTKNLKLSVLGVLLTALSALHVYFLTEFISQLGALAFMVWGSYGTVKSFQYKSKTWIAFAGVMFGGAIFSHRSAIWLILFGIGLFACTYLWATTRRSNWFHAIYLLAIAAVFLAPFVLAAQDAISLPDWLESEVRAYPNNPFRRLVLMESLLVLAAAVGVATVAVRRPELLKTKVGLVAVSGLLWTFLFIFNPFLNHQTGITGIVARLDSLIYLQAAIVVPLSLSLIHPLSKRYTIIIALLFLPVLGLRAWASLPYAVSNKYIQTRERLTEKLPLMVQRVPCANPLIIAKHGDQFLITASVQLVARRELPAEVRHQCVFWLIHQPEAGYNLNFEKGIAGSDGEFVLVEDSIIRHYVQMMETEELEKLVQENPHLKPMSAD